MDDASADLVLSLQLKDLNAILDAPKEHKNRTTVPDGHIALIAYRNELARRLQTLRDARLGRSIASAVQNDGKALWQARREENLAINDRREALRIGGCQDAPIAAPVIDLTDETNDLIMGRFASLNTTTAPSIDLTPRLRLTLGQELRRVRALNQEDAVIGVKKTCVSCSESVAFFAAVYAPCGHDYCSNCIRQLFFLATRDESLFPPRCCQRPIPIASADVFFTKEFVTIFQAKSIEWNTPDRTYCSWVTCAEFIPPSNIRNNIGVCPSCGFWTCSLCKKTSHEQGDCPQDPALNATIEAAKRAGWQRCYRCKRFVELTIGCNHITCHCRAEFCYVCAAPWRSCKCPLWHEKRLIQRANVLADRAPIGPNQPRQQVVQQIQEVLQQDRRCEHTVWVRHGQPEHCEGCGLDLPHFHYVCDVCGIVACSQCRHNRL